MHAQEDLGESPQKALNKPDGQMNGWPDRQETYGWREGQMDERTKERDGRA
jgi:hypothetical protein